MNDLSKTKRQLIAEVGELRREVDSLKNCEEQLLQMQDAYQKFTKAFIQSSIPMGLTTLEEGRFVDVSDSFLKMIGRRREEVIGYTSRDIGAITEEQRTVFYNELNSRGRVENLEVNVMTKNGEVRHGLFNAVMISLNTDKYLLTVMNDITERKKSEEALRDSERKYKFLAEKMNDILWIMDMELRTTYVSPSIQNVLGFSPEDRVRQDVTKQLTPDSLLIVMNALSEELRLEKQDGVNKDRSISLVLEYNHKDGSTRWLESVVSGIRDDRGVLIKLYGVSRNITERKHAEDALRQMEERFRQISHLTTDIIYSCVTDSDGGFSIDWMSGNAEKITGYTTDEIMAQSCWRFLVIEEDVPLFEEKVIGLCPGQSMSVDLRIRHKKGETIYLTSFAECKADSKIPGLQRLYGGLVDVTIRKRTEQEREELISNLQQALSEVKTLSGLLPICAVCKKIRDDKGYWNQLEAYIGKHTDAQFSHGICPKCAQKIYSELDKDI